MSNLAEVSSARSFGGWQRVLSHPSETCACDMRFAVYLPPAAEAGPVPVLYWLSGLTCTEENFISKAGAQRYAADHGLAIIAPDTSPRGAGVAGEDDDWDLGTGAGFYVDATEPAWATHYNMYSYITQELPALIEQNFPVQAERAGIFGHSMGGHGALVAALRNPGRYRSVSAFAPIVNPSQCPWGEKAFSAYLGDDRSTWEAYDATCLVAESATRLHFLIDQGEGDGFLNEQLKPANFATACEAAGCPVTLRLQPAYDHSYYFISTFMADHIAHHAAALA